MKKILIVEDEKDIRESLKDLLEMKGFEVLTAMNGKEALFVASTQKPDLILSDIMMPEINGIELLKIIQQNNDLIDIPFIFLTAKVDNESIRNGMNLGADDYLTKPVKKNELLDVIKKRLEKAEMLKKKVEKEYTNIVNQLNSTAQHEFYTPLNGILGFAELLKNNPSLSPKKIIHFSTIIEQSGIRLKNTLDNIMLYRTIISNNFFPKKQKFRITPFLFKKIAFETARTYKRKKDLTCQDFNEVWVRGDKDNFIKIMKELIDNAFKFSEEDEKVLIEFNQQANECSIFIKNFGKTFLPIQIEKIDAFVQFERKCFEQQGMGLGLFLSKQLANKNKWNFQITANNQVECTLTIPTVSL